MRASRWLLLLAAVAALPLLAGCGTGRFTPKGWSGLALQGDVLYIGSGDGRVVALDPLDGAEVWSFPAGGQDPLGPLYDRPALSEGTVYVATYGVRNGGSIHAIDAGGKGQSWVAQMDGSAVGGPVVAGDLVIVGASDGYLYALDRHTGARLWRLAAGGPIWSRPALDNGTLYFGSLDHKVYAVELESGTLKWSYETGGAVTGSPLVAGGRVYIGSFDRALYALDASTGELAWRLPVDHWVWAAPISDGPSVYVATMKGTVYAVDMAAGNELWKTTTSEKEAVLAPPLVVDDVLVVATDRGRLRVLRLQNGAEAWVFNLGAPVRSNLVGQGGVVYLSDMGGTVRAVNALRGTALWTKPLGTK